MSSHDLAITTMRRGKEKRNARGNNPPKDNTHKIVDVDIKEAITNVGVQWLQRLQAALQRRCEKQEQPEPCQKWVSEIRNILERRLQRPSVTVALYGQTGSGKSSVISAICDRNIVHSNAMQAGTEYITVIGFNHEATPENVWRAEIQTISEDEWESELRIFLLELHDLEDDEMPSPGSGSDANYAAAKILAVYPGADIQEFRNWTVQGLINQADLGSILGHNHKFSGKTLTSVKKQMEKFTGPKRSPRFSPLVSIKKIFGPIEFLRRGLEIADVPGTGDSSAARCRVAEQYQSKVDAFWIVSPIVRAVDDNIAKELFGTAWKQMLQLDGKLTEKYISFIMTKCDHITVSEVIDDLDMAQDDRVVAIQFEERTLEHDIRKRCKDRDRLRARIVEKRQLIENLQGDTSGWTESRSSSPCSEYTAPPPHIRDTEVQSIADVRSKRIAKDDVRIASKRQKFDNFEEQQSFVSKLRSSIVKWNSELLSIESIISKLNEQKESLKSQLTQIAMSARNDFCIERIRKSFSKEVYGGQDIGRKICAEGSPSVPGISTSASQSEPVENGNLLPVFCVSSTAYGQYRRHNAGDQRIDGFPSIDHTQIPQLREHCNSAALSAQKRFAEMFSSDLKSLVAEMKMWANDNEPERTITPKQKEALLIALREPVSICDKAINESQKRAHQNMENVLRNDLEAAIEDGAIHASQRAGSIVTGWFLNKKDGELHWASIRACARRLGGPHNISKNVTFKYRKGTVDLNADLAGPFRKRIVPGWNRLFHEVMRTEAERLDNDIRIALRQLLENMEIATASTCHEISFKWELLKPILERMIEPTLIEVAYIFTELADKARGIHRGVRQDIAKAMRPAYDECAAMKGKGVALRNRDILVDHIRNISSSMYQDAEVNMTTALYNAFNNLKTRLNDEIWDAIDGLESEYSEMVKKSSNTVGTKTSRAQKLELQRFILEGISMLDEAIAEVQLIAVDHTGPRTPKNSLADAARVKILDSSAQRGEDDYVSEYSSDSSYEETSDEDPLI